MALYIAHQADILKNTELESTDVLKSSYKEFVAQKVELSFSDALLWRHTLQIVAEADKFHSFRNITVSARNTAKQQHVRVE